MTMRLTGQWVVYRHPADAAGDGAMGVCRAAEWPGLDAARPGLLTLVRTDLPSEGLAERVARGTAGDPVPRAKPARAVPPAVGSAARAAIADAGPPVTPAAA